MSRHLTALADYRARLMRRISNQYPDLSALETIKLQWFRVVNTAEETGAADVYIYDEIGGSFGVNAQELVNEINALDVPGIDVHINSPGGDLFDSIAIYNALVKHPANITVYVDSLAASGASIIAQAGDKRVMMRGSQMMIHDALAAMVGNAADFRSMATFLDRQSVNIAEIYTARAGGLTEDWRAKMLAETWMFASEAVQMNLADEIYAPATKEETAVEDATVANLDLDKEFADLFELMTKRHQLNNRGYKYVGREAAPAPETPAPPVNKALEAEHERVFAAVDTDRNIGRMVKLLQKGLAK